MWRRAEMKEFNLKTLYIRGKVRGVRVFDGERLLGWVDYPEVIEKASYIKQLRELELGRLMRELEVSRECAWKIYRDAVEVV
jgi:hypothetical protein